MHTHQDWNTVVFHKAGAAAQKAKSNKALAQLPTKAARALLDDTNDDLRHKLVPSETKEKIIRLRVDKKLSREQLAQRLNMKVQDVADIETGKAIHNGGQIAKIMKYLES